MTPKKIYKQISGKQRKESKRRIKLINALINIRSYYNTGWYKNLSENDRQNLIWVLQGNKEWNGDVLNYFIRKYKYHSQRPSSWISSHGNRYTSPENRKPVEVEDLPF